MAVFRPTHPDIEPRPDVGSSLGASKSEKATTTTTSAKKKPKNKSGDVLSGKLVAPSFDDLPIDNDLDLRYYTNNYRGTYSVSRTWVFLGEITNNDFALFPFLRNRVLVRDRQGRANIPVYFYPEAGRFDYGTLKTGHTVAVLFAEQHFFMDGSIGLRLEELNHVKVIPCGLNDLLELSKHYSLSEGKCWGCGQEGKSLKKCGACKTGFYCNEKCQRQDWTKRHKKWCKAMPDFLFLSSLDYSIVNSKAVWR